MIDLKSFENQLLYTTVRIVAKKADGTASVGTAFFYNFPHSSGPRHVPVLITNKHVVEGAKTGEFLVHLGEKGPDGNLVPIPASETFSLDDFEQRWTGHPGKEDLCAMLAKPLYDTVAKAGKAIFYVPFEEWLIPTEDSLKSLIATEEVVMVGYPIGLWDEKNNFPVLRKGMTASHPYFDFNGRPHGVVDIAAFPGSSGSPVIVPDQATQFSSVLVRMGRPRIFLLGVLWGGPTLNAEGTIEIVDIPTAKEARVQTELGVHLGYYVKAKELNVLKTCLFKKLGA